MHADVRVESKAGKGAWLRITMGEGRKRQIREIGSLLGLPVVRIVRVRIGTLYLGALKPGEWRYVSVEELARLQGRADDAKPRVGTRPGRRTPSSSRPVRKPSRRLAH